MRRMAIGMGILSMAVGVLFGLWTGPQPVDLIAVAAGGMVVWAVYQIKDQA